MGKRIACPLQGHADEWIERVEKISRRQMRQWGKANSDETEAMMFGPKGLIVAWNLKDISGQPAPDPSLGIASADDLDVQIYRWLIVGLSESIAADLDLSPQLSGASPTTPTA